MSLTKRMLEEQGYFDEPVKTRKCPKCGEEMVELAQDYAGMTEGQQADYDAGFNRPFQCQNEECNYYGLFEVPSIYEEEDYEEPEEYSDDLIAFILDYQEDKIEECFNKKYYIEAIVYLHRQIFEELRYLLLKKVKGDNNIPLEESDPKYKEVVPFLKRMADETLNRMAFIYGRIDKIELGKINALNTLRNQFVHAWNSKERELRKEDEIKDILDKAKEIERRLNLECKKYGIVDSL
jgi:hypothetical protein